MSLHRHDANLGRLLDADRPANPLLGVVLTAVVPVAVAVLPWVSLGPAVGLTLLVLLWIPIVYGTAELLFLQNRIYEHGIVLRSIPGLRTYVIPHYTVDPADIRVDGRYSPGEIVVNRAQRSTRLAKGTLWFTGLDPKYAHRLAKGKLDWDTAGTSDIVSDDGQRWMPQADKRWTISYDAPEHQQRLLMETVTASQRVRPYYKAGWSQSPPS